MQDAEAVKQNQRKRKALSRAKSRAENKELEMKKLKEQVKKKRENKRIADHDNAKQQHRVWKKNGLQRKD